VHRRRHLSSFHLKLESGDVRQKSPILSQAKPCEIIPKGNKIGKILTGALV
jgi:hypothetical protein